MTPPNLVSLKTQTKAVRIEATMEEAEAVGPGVMVVKVVVVDMLQGTAVTTVARWATSQEIWGYWWWCREGSERRH